MSFKFFRKCMLMCLGGLALPGQLAMAEITLAVTDPVPPAGTLLRLESEGSTCRLQALDTDGEVGSWSWTLVEGPGNGRLEGGAAGGAMTYHAPHVTSDRIVHIRVADAELPHHFAEVAVQVVAGLQIHPDAALLVSGQELTFSATRGESAAQPVVWRLLDPQAGSVSPLSATSTRYGAPRVERPSSFMIQAVEETVHGRSVASAWSVVLPRVKPGALRLGLPATTLVAGHVCQLSAEPHTRRPGQCPGPASDWDWQEVGAGGGTLLPPGPGGVWRYQAPRTSRAMRVTLRVRDRARPEDSALLFLDIVPRLPGMDPLIAEVLMPSLHGGDWFAPLPSVRPFVWLELVGELQDLCPIPARPGAPGGWLVATTRGVTRLSRAGQPEAFWPVGHVTALTIQASPQGAGLLALYAQRLPGYDGGEEGAFGLIWSMDLDDPDMHCEYMAGTDEENELNYPEMDGDVDFRDGLADDARLGVINGLAALPDGTILFSDWGANCVRRLGADGQVATLAGHAPDREAPARDGQGAQARFHAVGALTLAPGGQTLYVADGSAIRTVTLGGVVATVLGVPDQAGFSQGADAGQPVTPGAPCLSHPSRLQWHGEHVFLVDAEHRTLMAYRPSTGVLRTLAGHPSQDVDRPGPLRGFAPRLSLGECAAFVSPTDLAIDADGCCLVAETVGWKEDPERTTVQLRRVELGPLAVRAPEAPAGAPIDLEASAAPMDRDAAAAAAPRKRKTDAHGDDSDSGRSHRLRP